MNRTVLTLRLQLVCRGPPHQAAGMEAATDRASQPRGVCKRTVARSGIIQTIAHARLREKNRRRPVTAKGLASRRRSRGKTGSKTGLGRDKQ